VHQEANQHRPASNVARLMWHGLAVAPGMAAPGGTVSGPRSFAFFGLFILFLLHILGALLDLFESIFRVELGSILASINSIRERLD